jgi:hypothetical protein
MPHLSEKKFRRFRCFSIVVSLVGPTRTRASGGIHSCAASFNIPRPPVFFLLLRQGNIRRQERVDGMEVGVHKGRRMAVDDGGRNEQEASRASPALDWRGSPRASPSASPTRTRAPTSSSPRCPSTRPSRSWRPAPGETPWPRSSGSWAPGLATSSRNPSLPWCPTR